MKIDIDFNFFSDADGGDPDITSPTLRRYHAKLWNKPLPSGEIFHLISNKVGAYLYHCSKAGEFYLGSDAITHSYKNQKSKKYVTELIAAEVNELFDVGSTIGAYIIFPNKQLNRKNTVNQARGVNRFIDDRFDLTLECIRLFYANQSSPLYDTLLRYRDFFDLFCDFEKYVKFFLLDDLIDEDGNIKFYLPFDNFKSRPSFVRTADYLLYKERVVEFVKSRNRRIASVG